MRGRTEEDEEEEEEGSKQRLALTRARKPKSAGVGRSCIFIESREPRRAHNEAIIRG